MPVGTEPISNDPAARVLPIYVAGDAPAPLEFLLEADANEALLLMALVSGPSAVDYLNTRHCIQAEDSTYTTLLGDTAIATDANASGGNVAETSFATQTGLSNRIRVSIPDKLEALVGQVDVWIRGRVTTTATQCSLRLLWGDTLGIRYSGEVKTITDPSITPFRDIYLGRVLVDRNGPLNMTLRIGRTAGAGAFRTDAFLLVPTKQSARISTPLQQTASGDVWHLDTEQDRAEILHSSGVFRRYAAVEGRMPFVAEPGLHVMYLGDARGLLPRGRSRGHRRSSRRPGAGRPRLLRRDGSVRSRRPRRRAEPVPGANNPG